jgi:hypothetical protein
MVLNAHISTRFGGGRGLEEWNLVDLVCRANIRAGTADSDARNGLATGCRFPAAWLPAE